jgi:transcriptional regulator with XRE-family HTH domain|nr:MAG TPA: Repressor protein CI [Caudoviricetes sp.]
MQGGMILKERIREIRKTLKLTQVEFGEKIGVKGNTVTNYETGLRNPTDAVLLSICREFNVNEGWLRTGEGEMFQIPDDEDAALISEVLENPDDKFYQMLLNMVRTYRQLSPESKKVAEDFIDQLFENSKNRKD